MIELKDYRIKISRVFPKIELTKEQEEIWEKIRKNIAIDMERSYFKTMNSVLNKSFNNNTASIINDRFDSKWCGICGIRMIDS